LEHNIILNDSKKFIKKTDNLTKIKSNNNEKCHPNQKENIQLQIQINQNENLFNEISVEKCYKSFNYLKLMESIFLKCLKCKKIFDDGNLSFIEKNFVDQIIIDNENMLNNQDFFDSEEFNIKDLQIGKKKRNEKIKQNKKLDEIHFEDNSVLNDVSYSFEETNNNSVVVNYEQNFKLYTHVILFLK
jgi:hypothetical protein